MILDANLKISASATPTQGTTTVSASCVDNGDVTPKRRIGDGEPLCIVFIIEAITASADTFSFEAISATGADLTGSVTRLALRGPFAAAAIPVGTLVVVDIPPGTPTQRYFGARYTLGASDALTVSAYVIPRKFVSMLANYASGLTIL